MIREPNTVNLGESICEPGAADDAVIAEEVIETGTSLLQSVDKVQEVISDQKRKISRKFKKNDKTTFTAANKLGKIEDTQRVINGRAGKANGKWKNCYNVLYASPEDVKGSVGWVDFDRVDNIDHVEELQKCFVSEIPTNVDFLPAKMKELDSWLGLGVYEPVSDCG